MEHIEIWKMLATILVAFITAWFSVSINNKKIEIENVTQERAKWREEIRRLSAEVSEVMLSGKDENNQLANLRSKFMLRLNPIDKLDTEIIQLIKIGDKNLEENEHEFTIKVAALLKHDWERAKFEAKPWYRKCGEQIPTRDSFINQQYGKNQKNPFES